MATVACPSCSKTEMVLTLENESSNCKHCGFKMSNLSFLGLLIDNAKLNINGASGRFYLRTKKGDSSQRVAVLRCYNAGVDKVSEVMDLDAVLPMVKNLKTLWPEMALRVDGGVSLHLQTCPLCGSEDLEREDDYDNVSCKNCTKFSVDLTTFVFSRVVASFRVGVSFHCADDRKGDKLELWKIAAVKPRKFRSIRSFGQFVLWGIEHAKGMEINKADIAKLHLREIRSEDGELSYVLAVEVSDSIGEFLEKSKVVERIYSCFNLRGIKIMDAKIL